MHIHRSLFDSVVRATALGLFFSGSALVANAQGAAPEPSGVLIAAGEAPALNLSAPAVSSSSSSGDSAFEALAERTSPAPDALSSTQPPPRRRYGRPNYADSHTNPDGSSKFAFMVGAGASVPTADTGGYLTPSYAFQVGAGRNFNKTAGLLLQFDYDHFGFTGNTLANQASYYNSISSSTSYNNLDGNSHIWSFTLNPTLSFAGAGNTGAYFVGGVGFYHKTAAFFLPSSAQACSIYGCYTYAANQTVDSYTSNAVGFNGGLGFTYKPSRFNSERLYMEARYVWIDNQPRSASQNYNYYPPNSNQTYYIPVTVGLRF
ncbi:MAG: hypothetical protein M3O02_07800 [Acidobacteriota bacterium]|nr:hypothetical protein [Acidobacteriota bacterium]